MEKFQHQLRTTLHTRSVQNIMTRSNFYNLVENHSQNSPHPKVDNLTTYLRKFQIERENLNLAKRIMQCESQHSRNMYAKQWKKTKKFLKVRSNFKKTLAADSPKIFKYEPILGHGRLLISITFQAISSNMCLLNHQSFYLLKFDLGSTIITPDKKFITLQASKGYNALFYAPYFLRKKTIACKLMKICSNNIYEVGKFVVDLNSKELQTQDIVSKSNKNYGSASFYVDLTYEKVEKHATNKENVHEKEEETTQNCSKVFPDVDTKRKQQIGDGIIWKKIKQNKRENASEEILIESFSENRQNEGANLQQQPKQIQFF